jgi:hypothetical protein
MWLASPEQPQGSIWPATYPWPYPGVPGPLTFHTETVFYCGYGCWLSCTGRIPDSCASPCCQPHKRHFLLFRACPPIEKGHGWLSNTFFRRPDLLAASFLETKNLLLVLFPGRVSLRAAAASTGKSVARISAPL